MEHDKTITSPEVPDPDKPTESQAVSRRRFIRRSAEVAALSLFGVLGLDAVTDKVLERIAESRAIGSLSGAAASALRAHRAEYGASADMYDWACNWVVINSCEVHGHVCHQTYGCDVAEITCNKFRPGCDQDGDPYGQYGCGTRTLNCGNQFQCDYNQCVPASQLSCELNQNYRIGDP